MDKEEVDRIRKDFLRIKKDGKISHAEADDYMSDITKLLGLFGIDMDEEIAVLLEEMLEFGEKSSLSVQGSRIEFESILNRK